MTHTVTPRAPGRVVGSDGGASSYADGSFASRAQKAPRHAGVHWSRIGAIRGGTGADHRWIKRRRSTWPLAANNTVTALLGPGPHLGGSEGLI